MYDFKHKIYDNQRFNSYEIVIEEDTERVSFYQKVRNGLFFVILVLSIFIIGAFLLKSYQSYFNTNCVVITQELAVKKLPHNSAHLALTQAITQSVVLNLQSQEKIEVINYNELKLIIEKVVQKIQEQPIIKN
jgi:ribonucleotide reductase alpha subunit